jgi:hypothetical protein
MNAARALLDELATIGATVEPVGNRLVLRAGSAAIPATLVNRVRRAKTDLLAVLAAGEGREAREGHVGETRPTSEACIVDWLNEHPEPSAPGRCAWCSRPESIAAMVLPFGTDPGTHTWLHADCWPAWHKARRERAAATLLSTAGAIHGALRAPAMKKGKQ